MKKIFSILFILMSFAATAQQKHITLRASIDTAYFLTQQHFFASLDSLVATLGGGGGGSVTSVGMTGDDVIYNTSVTGSPITTSGTLVPSLKSIAAGYLLRNATTGTAAPTMGLITAHSFNPTFAADQLPLTDGSGNFSFVNNYGLLGIYDSLRVNRTSWDVTNRPRIQVQGLYAAATNQPVIGLYDSSRTYRGAIGFTYASGIGYPALLFGNGGATKLYYSNTNAWHFDGAGIDINSSAIIRSGGGTLSLTSQNGIIANKTSLSESSTTTYFNLQSTQGITTAAAGTFGLTNYSITPTLNASFAASTINVIGINYNPTVTNLGGGTNYAALFQSGNVGIRTATPVAALVNTDVSVFGGNTTANASAVVEIQSTTKGLLLPRMTATQASAISSPADGLIVYVTDTNGTFTSVGFWGRVSGAWTALHL